VRQVSVRHVGSRHVEYRDLGQAGRRDGLVGFQAKGLSDGCCQRLREIGGTGFGALGLSELVHHAPQFLICQPGLAVLAERVRQFRPVQQRPEELWRFCFRRDSAEKRFGWLCRFRPGGVSANSLRPVLTDCATEFLVLDQVGVRVGEFVLEYAVEGQSRGDILRQFLVFLVVLNQRPESAVEQEVVDETHERPRVRSGAGGDDLLSGAKRLNGRLLLTVGGEFADDAFDELLEPGPVAGNLDRQLDYLLHVEAPPPFSALAALVAVAFLQVFLDYAPIHGHHENKAGLGQDQFDAFQQEHRLVGVAAVEVVYEDDDAGISSLPSLLRGFFEHAESLVVHHLGLEGVGLLAQEFLGGQCLIGVELDADLADERHADFGLELHAPGEGAQRHADLGEGPRSLGLCLLLDLVRDGGNEREQGMVLAVELPGVEPDSDHLLVVLLDERLGKPEQSGLAIAPFPVHADGERAGRADGRPCDHLCPGPQAQEVALEVINGLILDQAYRSELRVPWRPHDMFLSALAQRGVFGAARHATCRAPFRTWRARRPKVGAGILCSAQVAPGVGQPLGECLIIHSRISSAFPSPHRGGGLGWGAATATALFHPHLYPPPSRGRMRLLVHRA
jgi:hypothetical protein